MFKKDNFFFGFNISLLITAACFGLLWLLNRYVMQALFGDDFLRESTLMIVALGINIFILQYFTKRSAYKTGKGMLTFVFVWALLIIIYYFGNQLGLPIDDPQLR